MCRIYEYEVKEHIKNCTIYTDVFGVLFSVKCVHNSKYKDNVVDKFYDCIYGYTLT